jgi:hypothetical protein
LKIVVCRRKLFDKLFEKCVLKFLKSKRSKKKKKKIQKIESGLNREKRRRKTQGGPCYHPLFPFRVENYWTSN